MAAAPNPADPNVSQPISVPIVHEHLVVETERVETGRVRIAKQVREEVQTVEVPVVQDEVDVERVALHRPLDAMPSVRQEGDTLVIPVVREELVVEKRLVLVEEIRVTRKRTERSQSQDVTLRREELVVERQPGGPDVPG